MTDARLIGFGTIMSGKTTTGIGIVQNVTDYKHCVVAIAGAGTASFTVKCQGAIGINKPNFAAAQSATNKWDYVEMIDLQDGSDINGDTGAVFAADDVRLYEININCLDFITFNVTTISGGNCSIDIRLVGNQ